MRVDKMRISVVTLGASQRDRKIPKSKPKIANRVERLIVKRQKKFKSSSWYEKAASSISVALSRAYLTGS